MTEGSPALFTLTRTGETTETLTVNLVVTESGNMLTGSLPTSVTFSPGETTTTLSLPTENDQTEESDSTIILTLTPSPTLYLLETTSASLQVRDNDGTSFTNTFAPSSVNRRGGGGGGSSDRSRAREAIRELENLLEETPHPQAQEKLEEAQRAYDERDYREARTLARAGERLLEDEEETTPPDTTTLTQALQIILTALAEQRSCSFTRSLSLTSSPGADIHCLQTYLNETRTPVATTGPGSPGSETLRYGSLTKQALTRWQRQRVLPTTGVFDEESRTFYYTPRLLLLQLEQAEDVDDLRAILISLIIYVGGERR